MMNNYGMVAAIPSLLLAEIVDELDEVLPHAGIDAGFRTDMFTRETFLNIRPCNEVDQLETGSGCFGHDDGVLLTVEEIHLSARSASDWQ